MINNISASDLKKINADINIIDIRNSVSYNNNHIDGARNIVFNSLIVNPSKYLNKDLIYYIYCQKGIKSLKLCQILTSLGYKVVNINGGYESWILNK